MAATRRRLALVCGSLFQDGKECVVKEVVPGDSVNSLLSILDVITVSDSFQTGRSRGEALMLLLLFEPRRVQGAGNSLTDLDLISSSHTSPRVTSIPSGLCQLGPHGTLQC